MGCGKVKRDSSKIAMYFPCKTR